MYYYLQNQNWMGHWQLDEKSITEFTKYFLEHVTNLTGDEQDTDHPRGQWEIPETCRVKFLPMK